MGQAGCPKTLVTNYESVLRKIPEKVQIQLLYKSDHERFWIHKYSDKLIPI